MNATQLHISPTTGTATNRVILEATGASALNLTASTPSDIDVTGINTVVFDGYFNNGLNELGGHICSFRAERRLSAGVGTVYSVGNGLSSTTAGWVMPRNGTIVAIGLNCITASTATVSLIGSVTGTISSISLAAATQNFTTGLSASFVANEFINAQVTSGTVTDGSRIIFFVLFQ